MYKNSEFTVSNGRHVFEVLSGTVLETSQRSDTHVSGSGYTSGYVANGSGMVSGRSSMSSTTTIARDIWLKDDSGQEHHVRLDSDVPIRPGSRIHITTLRLPNSGKVTYSVLNENTREWYYPDGKMTLKDTSSSSFWRLIFVFALGFTLIMIAGQLIPVLKWFGLAISGVVGYQFFKWAKRFVNAPVNHQKKDDDIFHSTHDNLMEEILAAKPAPNAA